MNMFLASDLKQKGQPSCLCRHSRPPMSNLDEFGSPEPSLMTLPSTDHGPFSGSNSNGNVDVVDKAPTICASSSI